MDSRSDPRGDAPNLSVFGVCSEEVVNKMIGYALRFRMGNSLRLCPMPRNSCPGVISKLSARISIVRKPGTFLRCSNCEM